ncbi:MAG: hypothetical protein HY958_01305 [Bacteroidia bacterium]|nr:hypothetical protein [Bacteroidia bacterium]
MEKTGELETCLPVGKVLKRPYTKPVFEDVVIDNNISLIMLSPGSDPDPGSSSSGGDEW